MKTALILILLTTTSSLFAAAKEKHKTMPMEMTKEHRQEMAAAHEKMAACLKSERPMEECKKEMMEDCKNSMGGMGCMMHDMDMKEMKMKKK